MSGTTGTPRTQSYLLTTEFQDGQASGSISPQDMRDLVLSVPGMSVVFNVMNYGAARSGSSNPASGRYGSLAALQAVYGTTITVYTATGTSTVTVALTQELDWLATQAAINVAAAAGGGQGGVVYLPPGSYVFCNSNSVSDGSGTLSVPGTFGTAVGQVSISGDFPGTLLNWPVDLGSGKFALVCGDRTSGSSYGFFDGLRLVGPGVGSVLGASTSSMHGIGTNDRRSMRRIHVSAFRAGIDVVGGQFLWQDVNIGNEGACYYSVYFNNPNTVNFGNMQFIRGVFGPARQADFGVHQAASVLGSHFLSCALVAAPYGIFKETNAGAPTNANVIYECIFDNCQFENLGNAMVGEDTATPSNRVSTIFSTKFIMPEFLWGSAFKLSAVSAYAIIDVANCVGVEIDGIALASAWTPGITAIFSVPVYCNMIISGDLTTLFANCVAAVSPAVNQFMSVGNFQTVLHNKQGFGYPWSGQLAYVATGSATVGQVMLLNGSPSAGTTTETPMGIIMHAATSGTWFPAATSGLVTAKTTGSITQWLPLRTAAAGVGVTTGSNAVFGVAGFNVGTDLWLTYLRGL